MTSTGPCQGWYSFGDVPTVSTMGAFPCGGLHLDAPEAHVHTKWGGSRDKASALTCQVSFLCTTVNENPWRIEPSGQLARRLVDAQGILEGRTWSVRTTKFHPYK
ncbi:unnamed protein product [Lampetra fluviatilis]